MKKYIVLTLLAVIGLSGFAQKIGKYKTGTFLVYGNCGMCEERIENACDVVGVKRASWDEETEMLTITYNPEKISIEEIHQLCADVGHSTSKVKASEEAYANLHHCCKYVEHDHEGENEHENEGEHENH